LSAAEEPALVLNHVELIWRNPLFTACRRLSLGSRQVRRNPMLDVLMLALGVGFFVAAIGYTYACERL